MCSSLARSARVTAPRLSTAAASREVRVGEEICKHCLRSLVAREGGAEHLDKDAELFDISRLLRDLLDVGGRYGWHMLKGAPRPASSRVRARIARSHPRGARKRL